MAIRKLISINHPQNVNPTRASLVCLVIRGPATQAIVLRIPLPVRFNLDF
jgi:hypothetical protein